MEQSIENIKYEAYKSLENTEQITGKKNEYIGERILEINDLQINFGYYLSHRSFLF